MAGFGVGKKILATGLGLLAGGGAGVAYALDESVKADMTLHAPHLPWSHGGYVDSLDHASVRRGYQVLMTTSFRSEDSSQCSNNEQFAAFITD